MAALPRCTRHGQSGQQFALIAMANIYVPDERRPVGDDVAFAKECTECPDCRRAALLDDQVVSVDSANMNDCRVRVNWLDLTGGTLFSAMLRFDFEGRRIVMSRLTL